MQTLRLPEEQPWQASVEVGLLSDELPGRQRAVAVLLDCLLDSDFYTSVNVRG